MRASEQVGKSEGDRGKARARDSEHKPETRRERESEKRRYKGLPIYLSIYLYIDR